MAMMCVLVTHWRRKNYNKSIPTWLYYVRYWKEHVPEFFAFFQRHFYMVDEAFIERFNSVLRRRLRDIRDYDAVRRVASNILSERAEKFRSFYCGAVYDKLGTEQMDALAESTSQWILKLFVKVTDSNQAVVEHDSNVDAPKESLYYLPNVHGESQVVADMLPLAYGSDAPPSPALYCDFCRDDETFHRGCNHSAEMLVVDYLPCGHSLHKCEKCRNPRASTAADRAQCGWCFGYVVFYLRANCESAESSMAEISRPEDISDEFEEDAAIDNDDEGDEVEAGGGDDDDQSGGSNGSSVNSSSVRKKRDQSEIAVAATERQTRSRTQASQPEAVAAERAAAVASLTAAEMAHAEEVARAEREQLNSLSIDELRLILRNRLGARGADRVGRPPRVGRLGRR
jgi:hypothetical protein